MRLRADLNVGSPAADVWAAVSSPSGAACLPGMDPVNGRFTLVVETGEVVLEGSADVASDPRARTVTVDARGTEISGGGRARATLLLRVGDDGLFSTVDLEAEVSLTGEIAGRDRLVADALYRLADEWADRLEDHLGAPARAPAERNGDSGAVEPAAGDDGWLSRLIGKLRGR